MSESGETVYVREALLTDLEAIVAFNRGLARETEGKSLDLAVLTRGVHTALEAPERLRYWIAESVVTGRVVGQAAITREWSDWRNGWIWWFQSVYVDLDFRRRGIFRALHTSIRTAALDAGDVIGLRLYVEQDNSRAHKTYHALGMSAGGYHVFEELWPERFNR